MLRLNDILDRVASYNPDADFDIVKKAYVYSAKVHQGQLRKSGEPYLVHPLEVAGILAQLRLDEQTIVTGLLHDTIEDTLATPAEIQELFGEEVLALVDGVTKLSQFTPGATVSAEDKQAENFRKMIVAMSKDIRVILVKLADRTHNMRTMDAMAPEKQARIAQETLDIYAPLAHRLGIDWVKTELEDLSFKYLKPAEYKSVEEKLARSEKERTKFIGEVSGSLSAKLAGANLEGRISGRVKHLYSIWRKMKKNGVEFEELPDIIAFRLIMKSIPACYEALGLIHSLYKPVPGRFKDYIAIPKPNMYQSLHTTVIGAGGERVEIQIRTEEMHKVADEGIAAHWAYKAGKAAQEKDAQRFAWLRQLLEWQQDLKDPKEFLDTVKVDLFTDEVFVFTPKGDVKSLPRGATPVDLAFSIHTEVGTRCVGAKVNGKIVPLRYKLKNGDTVEILTSTTAKPSKDWLSFVKTSRAQNKIRAFIRDSQRERSLEIGKELCERELKRYGLALNRVTKSGDLEKAAKELNYRTIDGLISAVGYGKIGVHEIVKLLVPPEKLAAPTPELNGQPDSPTGGGLRLTEIFKRVAQRTRQSGGVRISGLDDVLVRYGKCCSPVPGDAIVGFVTRGRGVTVHTRGCPKALESDPERRVDVSWDVSREFKRPVTVRVITGDRKGLLADLTETFSAKGMSIMHADCRVTGPDRAVNTFEVNVADLAQLKDVIGAIERIDGVKSVERL